MITELVGLPGCGKTTYVRSLHCRGGDIILVEDINLHQRILALPLTALLLLLFLFTENRKKVFELVKLSSYISTLLVMVLFKMLCRRDVIIDQFLVQFALSLKMRHINNKKILSLIRVIGLLVEYHVIILKVTYETFMRRHNDRCTYTSTTMHATKMEYKLFSDLMSAYRQTLSNIVTFTDHS